MRHAAYPRLVIALTVALFFSLSLIAQAVPPAPSADASLVFAAQQAIMKWHIKQQDPVKLLAGALTGLRQALAKAGITERLADLSGADEPTAKSEFQARFDRAVGLGQGKLTSTQLQYAAAKAMAASVGDGGTVFLDPLAWTGQNLGFGRGYVGLGFSDWYKFGRDYVFAIAPYSPAASAGLRPFDRVLAVDGQSVQGLTFDDIGRRIVGLEGTTVKLTMRRPGQSTPLTFSIVRQRILRFPGVQHRMLDGRLGYIWVRSLGQQGDAAEFRRALVELQREGMRGLILDFRQQKHYSYGYGTGLRVANTLLPAGVPVQTIVSQAQDVGAGVQPQACPMKRDLGDPAQTRLPSPCTDTTSGGTLLDPASPLVVLIDETTHHSGETLSAAIRDTRRGRLVGVRTAGKAGVGPGVDLPGGAGIIVERFIVLAGNGAVLDKVGVQPDVPVKLTAADLDRGVDTQLQRAVEMLSR